MLHRFLCLLLPIFSGALCLITGCTSDSAEASTTEPVPADTEKIIATAKGGMPVSDGRGSTCGSANNRFTLVVSTRQLTWRSCSINTPHDSQTQPTWAFVEGQKTLTDAEYTSLFTALRALTPTSRSDCGADKPTLATEVTTPRGTTKYIDDFYACFKENSYVSGMDLVFERFDKLTSSSSN